MKIIYNLILRSLKIVLYAMAVTLSLLLLYSFIIWIFAPIYEFPKAEHFSGDRWYNPYRGLDSISWHKANLNSPSKTVTQRSDYLKDSLTLDYLVKEGFEYAAITNRFFPSFSRDDKIVTTPSYKFGYNIFSDNLILLGVSDFSIFDYPFIKTISASQKIINNLSEYSGTIIITDTDTQWLTKMRLKRLRGANLIHLTSDRSQQLWDYLLTEGKPLFLFIGDGMESKRSLMLPISANKSNSLNMVLNSGSFYGIEVKDKSKKSQNSSYSYPHPISITIQEDTLRVLLSEKVSLIELIGDNGAILASFANKSTVIYPIERSTSFIRIRASINSSEGSSITLLFNPLFRSKDGTLPIEKGVEISIFGTYLKYTAVIILFIVGLFIFKNSNFARRMKIKKNSRNR